MPKKIFDVVGFLSSKYIHTLGDFDYGLRASFSGYNCYISKNYVGTCAKNKGLANWCNPKVSFKQRALNFYEPTGLSFNEYIKYRKILAKKLVHICIKSICKTNFS